MHKVDLFEHEIVGWGIIVFPTVPCYVAGVTGTNPLLMSRRHLSHLVLNFLLKVHSVLSQQIFNALLLVLLVLHIYWSWLIFKVLHRSLTQGEVADVREEDED